MDGFDCRIKLTASNNEKEIDKDGRVEREESLGGCRDVNEGYGYCQVMWL